jgi:hypothetical protein
MSYYSTDPVYDAQRHHDARDSYADKMERAEIAAATDFRRAVAECCPRSVVLGKVRSTYDHKATRYGSRPEFLHETLTGLLDAPTDKLPELVWTALMSAAQAGHVPAVAAMTALEMHYARENASVDE